MDWNSTPTKQALGMIDWDVAPDEDLLGDARTAASMPTMAASAAPAAAERGRADLHAIPFELIPATPLPEAWESDSEYAWLEFDAAMVEMDLTTKQGRAEHAALAARSHRPM